MVAGKLGRYEIVGHLATGGMAEILLARLSGPSSFERPVVIKRILPHLARSRKFVELFLDEAQIVAGIRHPKVVQVHELVSEEDELFLVMEYIEGESLGGIMRRLWTRKESLDPILAAHVIAEACAGLHAAHELEDRDGVKQHLVHRDVSPQNVMVTYAGQVKVLDFGIAKANCRPARTETGQIRGKFEYMSPEQCRGEPLDRRSDVFGLGILLYELTVGARLFKRPSELMTLKAICDEPVTPPSQVVPGYPRRLETICLRSLAASREDRYRNAAEMRRDLVSAIRELGGTGLHDEAVGRLMQQLFFERMQQKRDMLRRVLAGSAPTPIPEAESDTGVELPPLGVPAQRSRYALRSIGLLAGVAGTLATVLALQSFTSADERLAKAGSTLSLAAATLAKVAPITPRSSARAAVDIQVDTLPAGARIWVEDREHGVTPARVHLPVSSRSVAMRLTRAGFFPLTHQVVPDVDQRLMFHLQASPPARPARRGTASSAPSGLPGRPIFQRFD